MKAESIEQIREHLARGGRVYAVLHDASVERVDKVEDDRIYAGIWSSGFACVDVSYWMLLHQPGPLPGVPASSLPIVTEDPTGKSNRFRDLQKERMQRIRKALLFGHIPSMPDLLSWWEQTTGEKIEHGKRCKHCECNGVHSEWQPPNRFVDVHCENCNGSGYTVRPTWMGERV